MPLNQYQFDELGKILDSHQQPIVALKFPGEDSSGVLYPNWASFYVWDMNPTTTEIRVAPIPPSQKKDYSERPFNFRGSQLEDYRVITNDLLIPIDSKDSNMTQAFRRVIKLEGFVRYCWGASGEYAAVGRVYGTHTEAGKKYLNLGFIPRIKLSMDIPNVIKRRSAIVNRRRELTGRRFSLDSIITFPIEKGNFDVNVIILERPKKKK